MSNRAGVDVPHLRGRIAALRLLPHTSCITMTWNVYLLRCRDGSLYCGSTNDITRRLAMHAAGTASKYTRSRLPIALAYIEDAVSRGAALKREAAIKRLKKSDKEKMATNKKAVSQA